MASDLSEERADTAAPHLVFTRRVNGSLELRLSGAWRAREAVPSAARVRRELETNPRGGLIFDTSGVAAWDSALVSFAAQVVTIAHGLDVTVDRSGLPSGVQRLLVLAEATPMQATQTVKPRPSPLARIGARCLAGLERLVKVLGWVGDLTVASVTLVTRRARFRRGDLFLQMELTGARGLGIVSLVSILLGLILAFISAKELERFGATLYVADLVGIAIVREMGAVMTAIVVAGRTGAAFAAELGTMQVTQEIDALTTLGISPVAFLVLPRVIAVTLMLPLLCVYADVLGILGGAAVSIGVMHVPARIYFQETIEAVSIRDLLGGMGKAGTYGFLIAAAACFEGLRSGRTAAAVGKAATAAVVDGIVLVIAACGLFAVLFYGLGI